MLRDAQRDPILTLILSLYLLLLAFFILLNNISEVEVTRSTSVAGSLENTFSTRGKPTQSPVKINSALGNVLGDETLEGRLEALVRSELRLATFDVIDPGHLMQLRVHESALFWDRDDELSGNGRDFVDRLISELARPSPGVRYGVEITLYAKQGGSGASDVDDVILRRISRAATLSQALSGVNLPRGSIAGGVGDTEPGQVRFLFEIRPEKETPLFEQPDGG